MLFSASRKVKTSELVYHAQRCNCGIKPSERKSNPQEQKLFAVKPEPPTDITANDKKYLNKAINDLVLSSLRPYELANEPFLSYLMEKALEVGARLGCNAGKEIRFCLEDSNKLITGDGVRKNLDKVYTEITG